MPIPPFFTKSKHLLRPSQDTKTFSTRQTTVNSPGHLRANIAVFSPGTTEMRLRCLETHSGRAVKRPFKRPEHALCTVTGTVKTTVAKPFNLLSPYQLTAYHPMLMQASQRLLKLRRHPAGNHVVVH